MRNEMKIFTLLIAFAQTSLASETIFEDDWNPVNFAGAVSKCRSETFLYLEKIISPLVFANTQNEDPNGIRSIQIAMTPDIEKAATEGCYCELFSYAKEHSYADFKKGKKITRLEGGGWKSTCSVKAFDEIKKFRDNLAGPGFEDSLLPRLQRD